MTREEYEAKYGVKPVSSDKSDVDTTPTPVLMTRKEYDLTYGAGAKQREELQQASNKLESDTARATNIIPTVGIPRKIAEATTAGLKRGYEGFKQLYSSMDNKPISESIRDLSFGMLNIAASVPEVLFSPVSGVVSYGANLPGVDVAIEAGNKYIIQPVADRFSDSPYLQDVAQQIPQREAESLVTLATLLFTAAKPEVVREPLAKVEEATYNPQTGTFSASETISSILPAIKEARTSAKTRAITSELASIESSYAPLKKSQKFEIDAGNASRERIAVAHQKAGILDNVVDNTGTLNTEGAVKKYAAETIDGFEGIVRQNLVREGKTVNINQIENALIENVNKTFEGANLVSALKAVQREVQGLRVRADEFGNIPLEKIQDAKVNTYKQINYKKDSNPTIDLKKTKASTYKNLIEDTSELSVEVGGKKYGVKDLNSKLADYYADIDRLKSLDGRKVSGGKLGKYIAQLSGTLIGGAAGSAFGFPGTAIGGAIGGEAARVIKGSIMERTFGKGGSGTLEIDPVLAEAQRLGKLPAEVNLKIADRPVGAPKGVIKTYEIRQVESQIKKNVRQQKEAIGDGKFAVVASLKVVYRILVEKLKSLIDKVDESASR